MATETGPDLSVAVSAIEALMDDTCVITVDSGVDDDVLNEASGELVEVGAPEPLYSGRCKVAPAGQDRDRQVIEGGRKIAVREYRGSIPLDAPVPPRGAILVITSSRRDPELVAKEFEVKDVIMSTFAVQRKLSLELRQ